MALSIAPVNALEFSHLTQTHWPFLPLKEESPSLAWVRLALANPTELPNPDPQSSQSRKKLLFWLLGFGLVSGTAGGFLYLFLKLSPSPVVSEMPQPKNFKDRSDSLNSTAAELPQPQSHRPSLRDSQQNASVESLPMENPLQPSTDDGIALKSTTRLRRMNIVEASIEDLQSSDPAKRRKAIWELGQQGDSRAIEPLVDLMLDSDSTQRSLILAVLSEIGARTLKPMHRALAVSLQDESAEVRKNAIRDLTRIYDTIAQMSQLLNHAIEDSDGEVSETAQWALSQLNRIRTLPGRGDVPTLPPSGNSSHQGSKE